MRIPAGEFMMGSSGGIADEQPVHRVRISQDFEMSKYEVTQAQWSAVMRDPHRRPDAKTPPQEDPNPSHFKGPTKPVESVSWDAVQKFLERLNIRDPKHVYRLPTEAEWEYAARAGSETSGSPDAVAWYGPNSSEETHPVGKKAPNAWGLYDMQGNVQEWVQDWYGPDFYPQSRIEDPRGPATGSYKIFRGCAWLSEPNQCRPAFRAFDFPVQGVYSVGFRLVRSAK